MLEVFMVSRLGRLVVLSLALLFSLAALSCESVPLLAPTGSTIVITAANTAMPTNSSLPIVAHVVESSGTPPHSGTRVTFTTSLGTIEPASADTDVTGQVVVTFQSGSSSGTATITAFSGGATVAKDGAVKIAVGAAAVGRVTLTANPNIIQANGGVATITANVADINGNILSSVPVNFATSAGALGSAVVNTNSSGVATTTLTTSVAATVTATVGVSSSGTGTGTGAGGSTSGQVQATVTVTVNPVPNVSVSAPGGTLTAGSPITFTISAQPAAGSSTQIRNVGIDFGDGASIDLGAVSGTNLNVQHSYASGGNYTVRVTATDFLNATTSAATAIVVLPQAPMSVVISSSRTVNGTDANFTFTATVTPATTIVSNYTWNFGDGSPSVVTTSSQTTHIYTVGSGSKNVSVTATATTGQTASSSVFVTP